jgi:hypothetical protein
MSRARLGAAILLLMLTTRWSKAGATKGAIGADLADCREQGAALIRRDSNIESDILATRARDWQRSSSLSVKEASTDAADQERAQNYVEDCMRAKGYGPGS